MEKSNIDEKYKDYYYIISFYFKLLNTENYKTEIFTNFIEIMKTEFKIDANSIIFPSSHKNNYIIHKSISATDFWNMYILNKLNTSNMSLATNPYRYLIYTIKILQYYYDVINIDANFIFPKNVRNLYIVKEISNQNVYFYKVTVDNVPTVAEFKKYITELINNKANAANAFSTKTEDGFVYTIKSKACIDTFN